MVCCKRQDVPGSICRRSNEVKSLLCHIINTRRLICLDIQVGIEKLMIYTDLPRLNAVFDLPVNFHDVFL